VQAGVSPKTVLQAGTINAAETLEVDDQYGTIEVGKIADLVVVENNPLENIGVLETPKAVV
jgi:imidazolonepropionase-like amidohydrolase